MGEGGRPNRTTVFEDGMKNKITLVTEYHGPYRKFYAQMEKVSGEVSVSEPVCWQGDNPVHDDKEKALQTKGWTKTSSTPDRSKG